MGVILVQTNTSNEVSIKSGGDSVSGQGEIEIKVIGSLPTLCPWCQRGREKMVLPSMPKGEIVGNMVSQVSIDVNTVTRLALEYGITWLWYQYWCGEIVGSDRLALISIYARYDWLRWLWYGRVSEIIVI